VDYRLIIYVTMVTKYVSEQNLCPNVSSNDMVIVIDFNTEYLKSDSIS